MNEIQWAKRIAEELIGTNNTLHNALAHYNMQELENDYEFCQNLDSKCFECNQCNYWYDIGDLEHMMICKECMKENEK